MNMLTKISDKRGLTKPSSRTALRCTRRLRQIRKISAAFQAANKRHRRRQTRERTDLAQQATTLLARTLNGNQRQETGTRAVKKKANITL